MGGEVKNVVVPAAHLKAMKVQAEAGYPRECCGLLLVEGVSGSFSRLVPCRNVQDEMHRRDPRAFPRDSRSAYYIDPEELLRVHHEMQRTGESIGLIYHSHIDAPPVFSTEDRNLAAPNGEPLFEKTLYLVIEVREGRAESTKIYGWDRERGDFAGIAFAEGET